MSWKAVKTWWPRVMFVMLFFVCYYFPQFFFKQSYSAPLRIPAPSKNLCSSWPMSKKWESLKLNIKRNRKLFLSMDDFFWKQQQSSLALPYGLKGSEPFLLKVLAVTSNYDMPANIEKLGCKSCIVVGNGFSNKNSSLGTAINKYDVIIRLNDAPVRGYEDDVGNRTTMRLFYPESATADPSIHNDPDTILVLVPFKPNDLRWLKEILYNEKRVQQGFWKPPPQIWLARASQIRVLDPYFMLHTSKTLLLPKKQQYSHPTTGILAVFVALNYCDVVHIVGFGYPQVQLQEQPIHYFGEAKMKAMKHSNHDLSCEAQTLKKLEDAGAIQYLHSHL
ncbi:hypothetical protein GJAV_G00053720 [Gymnothorax javanicus]|nr:hypothetical protein GJAV_G00053720 [Gymnothorax javanicus]